MIQESVVHVEEPIVAVSVVGTAAMSALSISLLVER
jgi:hypothetical protein